MSSHLVALIAGCNKLDPDGDPCRSPCELQAASCPPVSLEDFEGFETASGAWRESIGCPDGWSYAVAGACADGTPFLFGRFSEGSEVRYYDADSGEFVALTTETDSSFGQCGRRGYWPFLFECANALATEVFCGDAEVGGSVSIP